MSFWGFIVRAERWIGEFEIKIVTTSHKYSSPLQNPPPHKQEISNLKSDNMSEKLQFQLQHLENKVETTDQILSEKDTQIDLLNKEMNEYKIEIAQLKYQVENSNSSSDGQISSLNQKLANYEENLIPKLEAENKNLSANIAEANIKIATFEANNSNLQEKIQLLENSANSQLETSQKTVLEAQEKSLQITQELNAKIASLEAENSNYKTNEIPSLQEKLEKTIQEFSQFKNSSATEFQEQVEKTKELSDLISFKNKAEQEIESLNEQLIAIKNEKSEIQNESLEVSTSLVNMTEELTALKNQLEIKSNELTSSKNSEEMLKQNVEFLQGQIKSFENSGEKVQEENKTLNSEMNEIKAKLQSVLEGNERYKLEIGSGFFISIDFLFFFGSFAFWLTNLML